MAKAAVKAGMKNRPRDDEDEDDIEEEEDEAPKAKAKAKAKAKPRDDDEDEEEDEDEAPKAKSKAKAKTRSDDDDEDEDDDGDEGGSDTIDLSSADEDAQIEDEVVPNGKYACTVMETEFVEFQTGSKGMKVRFEVAEGPFAKSKKRKNAKNFWTNIVLSPKAANLLKANLKGLGVDKKVYNSKAFSAKMLRDLADGGDLLGNEVWLNIRSRAYEGVKRNEVRGIKQRTDDVAEGDGDYMDD